jgi:hypothetical protein
VDLQYCYRIGASTIRLIVKDVCAQIWIHLKDICIADLTEENWVNIANGFQTRANFLNCIGAINSKHIRIIKPKDSGSLYYNYELFFNSSASHV